ncbi:MAG: excinuclease ABC subunit UvrA [Candidatus Magasanikbacteria bacterium]|nr:excinuclease ABC subunit UvrA [Candidatus Magasanikbacteria bacterium]
MQEEIVIKGAREHNLKNISLRLPRNKMIVFTGLSGSGKSSLAFDTIFAEGQRRYVESLSAYARQFLGQMQKPDVDEIEGLSPAISIDQKAHSANPRSTVATITEVYDYLRVLFARVGHPFCVVCGDPIRKLTVEEMMGMITSAARAKESGEVRILAPVVRGRKGEYYQLLYDLYNAGFQNVRVDGAYKSLKNRIIMKRYEQHTIELVVDTLPAFAINSASKDDRVRLAETVETAVDYGNGVITVVYPDKTEQFLSTKYSCPRDGFAFPEIEPRLFSFNSPYGYCQKCTGLGTESLFSAAVCGVCNGARLRPESLAVKINGKNINDITHLSIEESAVFLVDLIPEGSNLLKSIKTKQSVKHIALGATEYEIAEPVLREIIARIQFMVNVGLTYLTLDRKAGTLSGGEAQRIRLASQIGSRLVGALYVLDEPTIGLHQRDNDRLVSTLEDLRDIGNTIIVVEHDEDTILASDYMVDFGPGAGKHGGKIVVAGPTDVLLKKKINETDRARVIGKADASLTLQYLRREKLIPLPAHRRKNNKDCIKIKGATEHNLKNIDVEIPLRRLVCVTGVSGSGKSTLVDDILYKTLARKLNGAGGQSGAHKMLLGLEYLDRVIEINQSAIGRSSRSNPATYTGSWTPIRELFAATPEARFRGFKSSRFSFNVRSGGAEKGRGGGRCEQCQGLGEIAIEMHFLPAVYVPCDVCGDKRFDRETLEIHYKEKNIYDILKMTIAEAEEFFRDIPEVYDNLKVMNEVGLNYLELGQSSVTLSGGEAQRIKLASELSRRDRGRSMYILDEPTTGLHFEDIRKLLAVLERLVAHGNSVVVIEHNLEVIKTADYIIDLGPEGGSGGGQVIANGTPEDVARNPRSFTGQYLKRVL